MSMELSHINPFLAKGVYIILIDNDPVVSVVVPTYGHEKYIKQALDSILMQIVNFKYEIIVGEDCSSDNTRLILKDYELNYPEVFTIIYRNKNVGAHENVQDLYKRCRGNYIAYLEGDDYWTSNVKLQTQVDYLESHKEFIATAHRVVIVDEYGNKKENESYPECKDENYTLRHYKNGLLPGQSATLVYRNIIRYNFFDTSIFKDKSLVPGDRVKAFLLVSYGKIHCFAEIMSAYRHITDHGTSYSATMKKKGGKDSLSTINYYYTIMMYSKNHIPNIEAIKVSESLYFWNIIRTCRKDVIGIRLMREIFSKIEYGNVVLMFVFYQIISWPLRWLRYKNGGSI